MDSTSHRRICRQRGPADLSPATAANLCLAGHARQACASKGLDDLAEGYRKIPNFNGNPVATFFGEKRLFKD